MLSCDRDESYITVQLWLVLTAAVVLLLLDITHQSYNLSTAANESFLTALAMAATTAHAN